MYYFLKCSPETEKIKGMMRSWNLLADPLTSNTCNGHDWEPGDGNSTQASHVAGRNITWVLFAAFWGLLLVGKLKSRANVMTDSRYSNLGCSNWRHNCLAKCLLLNLSVSFISMNFLLYLCTCWKFFTKPYSKHLGK